MIINNITLNGIEYLDANGAVKFISFVECNENWLDYRKRTESLDDDQVAKLRGTSVTIGQRDIAHSKAYIEFFTKPFVRFEFELPAQESEYKALRDAVWHYGWATIDLS